MISDKIRQEIQELFDDPTISADMAQYKVVSIISELEEEITELKEKIERLEYHLGLTGVGD